MNIIVKVISKIKVYLEYKYVMWRNRHRIQDVRNYLVLLLTMVDKEENKGVINEQK